MNGSVLELAISFRALNLFSEKACCVQLVSIHRKPFMCFRPNTTNTATLSYKQGYINSDIIWLTAGNRVKVLLLVLILMK